VQAPVLLSSQHDAQAISTKALLLLLLLLFLLCCFILLLFDRYLHDAFTVRGAKQNVRSTHKWRQKFRVDSAFERPVPYHSAVTTAFPTYTLMDESPDGHAVLYTKVSLPYILMNEPPYGHAIVYTEVEAPYTLVDESADGHAVLYTKVNALLRESAGTRFVSRMLLYLEWNNPSA
jgi:hypothetical protein